MKKFTCALAGCLMLTACTTANPYSGEEQLSKTSIGTATGAILGGVAGALIGQKSGNARKGALIGAGIGALSGAGVGNYMDNQEAQLRDQLRSTGVSVTRVGDNIILNMPGNVTFATDSDQISPAFDNVLASVALVLNKYSQSLVDVSGHTDNVGTHLYNMELSQRRAESVAQYLVNMQVNPQRLSVQGFGDTQPIAPNTTEAGRSQNRRVEIKIVPLT